MKGSSSSRAKNANSVDRYQRKAQSSPELSRQSNASTDDDEDDVQKSGSMAVGKDSKNQYRSIPQADSPSKSKPSSASPKKLGLVGGMHRKRSFLNETRSPKSPSPANKRYAGSDTDPAGGALSSTDRDLNYPKSPMKAKGKLGTIGGRNKGSQARDRAAHVEEKSLVLLRER